MVNDVPEFHKQSIKLQEKQYLISKGFIQQKVSISKIETP